MGDSFDPHDLLNKLRGLSAINSSQTHLSNPSQATPSIYGGINHNQSSTSPAPPVYTSNLNSNLFPTPPSQTPSAIHHQHYQMPPQPSQQQFSEHNGNSFSKEDDLKAQQRKEKEVARAELEKEMKRLQLEVGRLALPFSSFHILYSII